MYFPEGFPNLLRFLDAFLAARAARELELRFQRIQFFDSRCRDNNRASPEFVQYIRIIYQDTGVDYINIFQVIIHITLSPFSNHFPLYMSVEAKSKPFVILFTGIFEIYSLKVLPTVSSMESSTLDN